MWTIMARFERSDLLPIRLADHIRSEIIAGRYKPGDRLIEQSIAAECGVSRVPLREAIRILASEGLVTMFPHRGASVSVLSESELIDLFGARAAIEAMAARNAAKRKSPFAIETIRRILKQMRQAVASEELATYYALAGEFHRALVEAGGNAVMLKLYDQIRGQLRRVPGGDVGAARTSEAIKSRARAHSASNRERRCGGCLSGGGRAH